MALNNYYTIVNISGNALQTTINGKNIYIPKDKEHATGHTFEPGENISATISGHTISLFLPKGKNSWSTIVYTKQGIIQIFPSSPNQLQLSY